MEWSSSIYNFISTSCKVDHEIIEKHMKELYKLDKIMENSKIEKLLRQIRALSVGISIK